jgi:hypothetical protein
VLTNYFHGKIFKRKFSVMNINDCFLKKIADKPIKVAEGKDLEKHLKNKEIPHNIRSLKYDKRK